MTSLSLHLVVPGQVVATSSCAVADNEDSFLKGHGTYVERVQDEQRLVASVVGLVHRVNKLITVIPASSSHYEGQVGDLIVGQVTSVQANRWKVALTGGRDAQLPLQGIVLPGGVQRVRTAQDQRDMRQHLQEGDWISAEVHKVSPNDGSLLLHTRSTKYGKLECGTVVRVPPALVARRKNHNLTDYLGIVDIVWGTNGLLWIQRKLSSLEGFQRHLQQQGQQDDLRDEDRHEQLRKEHAATPLLREERMAIARVRNAMECLSMVHAMVTPEAVEQVYHESVKCNLRPADMLLPNNIVALTASTRK
jgi:exosome complex component RRP4